MSEKEFFDERLMCSVVSLEYDFTIKRGRLFMPDMTNTDMGGCIKLFEGIDKRVKRIETFAGADPDTTYRRRGDKWTAYLPADVD